MNFFSAVRNVLYLIFGLANRVAIIERALDESPEIPISFRSIREDGERVVELARTIDPRVTAEAIADESLPEIRG